MNKNRINSLISLMLLTATSLTAQNKIIVCNEVPGMTINKVSDNGKYVVGSQLAVQSFLWEPENNNKITYLTGLDEAKPSNAKDVSNDGVVVGLFEDLPAYWKNGEWTKLPLPNKDDVHGSAQCILPDGSLISGYTSHLDYVCTPCLWRRDKDGVYQLETVKVAEKDQVGMEPRWGFIIDDMSIDGTVLSGRMWDHDHQWQGVFWAPESDCTIYGKELFYDKNGEIIRNEYGMTLDFTYAYVNKISPNGRYITGPTMKKVGEDPVVHKPFVYDREKDKFSFINATDAVAVITSNDGLTFYASSIQSLTREGFVYNNNTKQTTTMQDWLFNNHGLDLAGALNLGGLTGTIEDVNSNLSVLVGNLASTSNYMSFYIKIGEAPAGVDAEQTDKLSFYVAANRLHIKGEPEKLSISDLSGRKIHETVNIENEADLNFLQSGIYLVTVNGQGSTVTQKVIITAAK